MFAALMNLTRRNGSDPLHGSSGIWGLGDKLNCLSELNWPNVKLDEGRFVVFDTETTGLYSLRGDEIISIGGMVIEEGGFTGSCFFQLVNPNRNIPPLATKITGITEDMVKNAPDVLTVLDKFLGFTGCNMLIGHCVPFDLGFINNKLNKYCGNSLNVPVMDTMAISQILFPNRREHTLEGLAETFGISLIGRHTALGDCLITAQLFFFMVKYLNRIGIHTTRELLSHCQFRGLGIPKQPFSI